MAMRPAWHRPLQLLLALALLLASGHAARHLLGHAVEALGAAAASALTPPSDDGPAAHCDACDGLKALVDALSAPPPPVWRAPESPGAHLAALAPCDAATASRLAYRSRAPPAA
jgi:hypothetical protein